MIIAMTVNNILVGAIVTMLIMWWCIWIEYRESTRKSKVGPRIAICTKCRYRRKKGRLVPEFQCLTPKDPTETNFISGKKYQPTFSCKLRNSHGQCVNFKRRWLW